jgi:hypothetical protein
MRNSYNTANLQCPTPTDQFITVKFVDPGRLGVTLGQRLMGCICTKGFFETIEKFITTTITIPAGETVRIEPGNVANIGKRRDTKEYDITSYLDESYTFSLFASTTLGSGSITFQSAATIGTFVSNAREAINQNTTLKSMIELSSFSETDNTIILRTIATGYTFTCDLAAGTELLSSTQIYTPIRYTSGRMKFMFLLLDYDEFTTPIPGSNEKHVTYAFDDDYNSNINTPENITWRHIGKMFSVSGDNDILESDMNLVETIWISNPLTRTVTIQALIAS